jgi:nucleoside-diphosphate-sugar epimerase
MQDDKFCRTSMFLSAAFGAMSHEKVFKELSWTPRSLSDTVADAIRWYRTENL